MKFGKAIVEQALPGWSAFYCDYKSLKKIINSLAKGRPADAALLAAGVRPPRPAGPEEPLHPSAEPQLLAHSASVTSGNGGQGSLLQAHKAAFFYKLERELEKINNFYYQREAALKVRLRTLIDKRKLLTASLSDSSGKSKVLSRESSIYGALHEGFRNFERDLGRLQAYIELNATAFRKICKKWDKACRRQADRFGDARPQQGEHDGQLYLARQVEVQPVFNREFIAELSDGELQWCIQRCLPSLTQRGHTTVASANLLSLEILAGSEGKHRGDALADGADIEQLGAGAHTQRIWAMDAEADSTEALEDLEQALVTAVKMGDAAAARGILESLAPLPQKDGIKAPVSRILWRATLEAEAGTTESIASESVAGSPHSLIPFSLLDFAFVDDISGRTTLHETASAGKLELVKACLQNGVSISQADVYGRQALHYAAINGHSAVGHLLLSSGADATVLDFDGYSPITYAITNGRTQVVQTFIDQGISFDTASSTTNEDLNALSLASQHGHEDIARILLSKGAQILPSPAGYWPQHLAARQGHAGVLRLLVEATRGFAGIDLPDKYSQATPLHHAASHGHAASVQVLLHAGSNVHSKDEFQRTPIHYAAWHGYIDCVNLLLAAGANMVASLPIDHPLLANTSNATGPMSSADLEPLDLESDLIPSLSLPPPIIPFRIYGHSFLDKKCLVQICLGHPNTSCAPFPPPIRLADKGGRGQQPSLKLVMTPKPESIAVPHSVILPLADEREVFPFQVESFDNFSLEFDLFPTFGSKVIGKAVAAPSTFDSLQSQGSYVIPLLDPHLKVIGDIPFEINVVKPFERATLQLGGQFETYWRSMTALNPSGDPAPTPVTGGASVVTASSLSGEHVRVIVQVTSDGVPVAYPQWKLPLEGFDVHVGDVTFAQFESLAQRTARRLDPARIADPADPVSWYQAVSGSLVSLDEIFQALPASFGVDLEVRYPTRSDMRRLNIHHSLEVNQFVDCVLSTVYEAIQNGDEKHHRRIVFSSFNPLVCTALNWKQPNFSVFFASYCGISRSNSSGQLVPANRVEDDRRCTSIREAVKFAKTNNLLGVMLDATILLKVPSVIQSVKEQGLLVTTFGPDVPAGWADAHMASGVLSYASSAFLQRTEAS
ncbi:BQ5605_C005g03428 [Microbotryum silenes-dioicae]|uniref:BQ5605_C005g03428 protein n=1 Tax=Microbotryum silenes-dioicae TaxID=796604 RepID=A0A2X0PCJ0_9BASI|nr:BQ5605_C005g03428 [Microbotryum silenes-dioicae]